MLWIDCRSYCLFLALLAVSLPQQTLPGQSVSFLTQRVFVTGYTPVIGPGGGVGGVDVDAAGVLNRVVSTPDQELAELRANAMKGVANDLRQRSSMRKVSLRRLESEIASRARQQKMLTADLLFLAGLQRIEYVFLAPQTNDLVIAGPAEGWVVRGETAVGASSGAAVLRLDDLLDALQGRAAAVEGRGGISCSIDPSPTGMARLARLLKTPKLQLGEAAVAQMERQLGDSTVTVTGVRPDGHFARVMVGADYMMKRIAMGLDRSPVAEIPSYLQLLARGPGTMQIMTPRWWIATDYETIQKSPDGLAWRLQGPGVKVMSEHGYLNARGEVVNAGRSSRLAQLWADKFTDGYDQLAQEVPVFGQLRGCVDLAMLAALLTRESLLDVAGCRLPLLSDPERLSGKAQTIPQFVPAQASVIRGRQGWIVSVSGGIDVDTWNSLDQVQVSPRLEAVWSAQQAAGDDQRLPWWWD